MGTVSPTANFRSASTSSNGESESHQNDREALVLTTLPSASRVDASMNTWFGSSSGTSHIIAPSASVVPKHDVSKGDSEP